MKNITDLFQQAIGLFSPWFIDHIDFSVEKKQLDVFVDFPKGTLFHYEEKGDESGQKDICGDFPVYDTTEKVWRHLNFFQHECYLHCRVPRLNIGRGKTRVFLPPFTGLSRGFTLLFESLLLQFCKGMTIAEVSRLTQTSAHKLWEMIDRYVSAGRDLSDYVAVCQIGVDETAIARGHHYLTIFVDLLLRSVMFVTEGKDSSTIKAFSRELLQHNGNPESITDVSSDLSPAFIKGVKDYLPQAKITFDKFHVVKLINQAVDEVRRAEVETQPILKYARYSVLKNETNLTSKQRIKRQELLLSKRSLKTVRAMQLRENFQAIYTAPTQEDFVILLKRWYFWATHSRLPAMITVAKTIKTHWSGIVGWYESRINNGIMEGINSLVQAAKSKARGYRTIRNFTNIIYLLKGNLNFAAVNQYYPHVLT
jgi:transposase